MADLHFIVGRDPIDTLFEKNYRYKPARDICKLEFQNVISSDGRDRTRASNSHICSICNVTDAPLVDLTRDQS